MSKNLSTAQVIKIVVKGRIPSKKNSRNCFVRGGKLLNIPSKAYAEFHKDAAQQIKNFKDLRISGISRVELVFWAPDKRASDLSNKAESIMDLLVDCGIIEDDNWFIINKLYLIFGGIDKSSPRCEISIYCDEQRLQ